MAKKKKDSAATEEGGDKEHKKNWRETRASSQDILKFLNDNIILRQNVITGRPEFRVPEEDEFESLGMVYPLSLIHI